MDSGGVQVSPILRAAQCHQLGGQTPFVGHQVAAIIELQWLTGACSGEVG